MIETTLTLPLKRKWFDLIRSGEKREEYREMSPYWKRRLESAHWGGFRTYDRLVFTLGYPKAGDTERRLEFANPQVSIGFGLPEWGAEPGRLYFVITWEAK